MKIQKNMLILASLLCVCSTAIMTSCNKADKKSSGKEAKTITSQAKQTKNTNQIEYSDGIYRGFFLGDNNERISIEFELKDNKFDTIKFRTLKYGNHNYLANDISESQKQILTRYTEALDYLNGKLVTKITDLSSKELFKDNNSQFHADALITALQDGLSRGVYELTQTTILQGDTKRYADGLYRGYYMDEKEQIVIQFTMRNNNFQSFRFLELNYNDYNYLTDSATKIQKQILKQYKEAANYLKGKDATRIPDLYVPGQIVTSTDSVTGATLPSNKLASAIKDGLNHGITTTSETN